MSDFEPVPAVPSASLILLRDSSDTLQVLIARRSPELRMAGNFWVFPGGALDNCDRKNASHIDAQDKLLPYRLNALRETREEVAVEINNPQTLAYFARWVAPDQMAMRFDTRFFVTRFPDNQVPKPDGSELVEYCWLSPGEAFDKGYSGEFLLMFPTLMNLRRLMIYSDVQQVLDAAQRESVQAIKPGLSFRNGKGVAHVPPEVGFGLTEWEFTYPIKTVK